MTKGTVRRQAGITPAMQQADAEMWKLLSEKPGPAMDKIANVFLNTAPDPEPAAPKKTAKARKK